jgi:hypothetical protein
MLWATQTRRADLAASNGFQCDKNRADILAFLPAAKKNEKSCFLLLTFSKLIPIPHFPTRTEKDKRRGLGNKVQRMRSALKCSRKEHSAL